MHRVVRAFVLLLPLVAEGCLHPPVVEDHVYSPCHAVSAGGWSAHVERIPDHHNRPVLKPTLIVSGKVTVPGDGYAVSLDLGPVQRFDTPVQQIMLRTDGSGNGTPTTLDVSGTFPALKRYGAVTIRCGDGTIAIIKPVPRRD
jgi:hypothetical protein